MEGQHKTYRPWDAQQNGHDPISTRDAFPEDDLVFFLIDLIPKLDLTPFHEYYSGELRGQPPFDVTMMVTLLVYAYADGACSSRRIAAACERNLAFRAIVGSDRPDFRTISDFRKIHRATLKPLFVEVLRVASELGMVKLGSLSTDGTNDLQESRFQRGPHRAIISGMWSPSTLTPSQMEERRLEGGRLLREGRLTRAEIAARLGVSTQAVGQWAKAMGPSLEGIDALRGRRRTGRPPLLTPEQWEEILSILASGALEAGSETERRTLQRIRQVIMDRFGVDYHAHYLAERLRTSGWTAQVPAVQARERDEELVRAWLDRDWPRVKKKLGARVRRSSSSTRQGPPSGPGRGRHGPRPARPPSCDGSANVARSRQRSD